MANNLQNRLIQIPVCQALIIDHCLSRYFDEELRNCTFSNTKGKRDKNVHRSQGPPAPVAGLPGEAESTPSSALPVLCYPKLISPIFMPSAISSV